MTGTLTNVSLPVWLPLAAELQDVVRQLPAVRGPDAAPPLDAEQLQPAVRAPDEAPPNAEQLPLAVRAPHGV
jgi:hypothetical protein